MRNPRWKFWKNLWNKLRSNSSRNSKRNTPKNQILNIFLFFFILSSQRKTVQDLESSGKLMRTAYRNDEFQQVPEKNNWRDPRRNSWYSTERTTKIIKKGSPLQFPEKKNFLRNTYGKQLAHETFRIIWKNFEWNYLIFPKRSQNVANQISIKIINVANSKRNFENFFNKTGFETKKLAILLLKPGGRKFQEYDQCVQK